MILVTRRRGVVKPDHTYHDLDKCAQKHQEKLQIQSPPFTMETRRNLGLKYQKDSISFDKDAGDAENKTDPKGGLA